MAAFPKKKKKSRNNSFYLDGVRSVNTSQLAIAAMCWCVRCKAEWNGFLNAACLAVDIESVFRHCQHWKQVEIGRSLSRHTTSRSILLLLDLPKTVGSIKTCMSPQAGKKRWHVLANSIFVRFLLGLLIFKWIFLCMNKPDNNALHQSQALSTAPSEIQLITPKFHHLMPPVRVFLNVGAFFHCFSPSR